MLTNFNQDINMFKKLAIISVLFIPYACLAQVYEVQKGMIRFFSEAP